MAWGESSGLWQEGFGLGAALEEEAPPTPRVLCAPPGPGGFENSGAIFSTLGVGSLSAFRDSPLDGTFFVGELGMMHRGTLHRSSKITKESRIKGSQNWAYLLDRWIRIFFREPEGGVRAGEALGAGLLILIMLADLPVAFSAFFWGVGLAVALCFSARIFDTPALAPADGSLADSQLGDRAETGFAGIGMSPSNLGMWEMKLSRACIQTFMI
jgi:hypothetical protein